MLGDHPVQPKKPWKQGYNRNNQLAYPDVTLDAINAFKEAVAVYEKQRKEWLEQRAQFVRAGVEALKAMGFPESRSESIRTRGRYPKYLTHKLYDVLCQFVPCQEVRYDYDTSNEEQYLQRQEREQKEAESQAARKAYEVKAVQWLLGKGKVFGQDFTQDSAVKEAESIAFQEEVQRRIEEIQRTSHFTEFDGQNCNGPCAGWDGVSRRCDCGNRRVSWTWNEWATFEQPSVRGEAY